MSYYNNTILIQSYYKNITCRIKRYCLSIYIGMRAVLDVLRLAFAFRLAIEREKTFRNVVELMVHLL